jgi:hypothetical protein
MNIVKILARIADARDQIDGAVMYARDEPRTAKKRLEKAIDHLRSSITELDKQIKKEEQ